MIKKTNTFSEYFLKKYIIKFEEGFDPIPLKIGIGKTESTTFEVEDIVFKLEKPEW